MSRLNPFTTDRENRAPTIAAVLALAAVLGIAGVAVFGGAAAAQEAANTSVEVTNDTGEIWTNVEFADVDDANATADVVITDANDSEIVNESVSGNGSEIVTSEWAVNDSDPVGNYTIVVEADSGVVADVGVGTFSESSDGGGGSGGSGNGSVLGSLPMWLVVVGGLGVIVYGYTEGWFEDL